MFADSLNSTMWRIHFRTEMAPGQVSQATQDPNLAQPDSWALSWPALRSSNWHLCEYLLCFHWDSVAVYVTPKSLAKTESGILQHHLKSQTFQKGLTHVIFEMFRMVSQFRWDMPPWNNCGSICSVLSWPQTLEWALSWGTPDTLSHSGLAGYEPWGRLWPSFTSEGAATQKGWRNRPKVMHEDEAEPGLFDSVTSVRLHTPGSL